MVIYRYIGLRDRTVDIQTDRQTDSSTSMEAINYYGKDTAGIAMEAINYGNI